MIEYIAQTRAWFYVMHVLGTALFDKNPFKNVLTTGVIFGTDGRKMSKSFGNYPDPKIVLEKYGAEPLRLYLMGAPVMVGEDINLDEEQLRVQVRDFILPLWNCYSFFVTYANVQDWKPAVDPKAAAFEVKNELDKWVLAKFNDTVKKVTKEFDHYNLPAVVKEYYAFLDDLSKWYIRRSRSRFAANNSEAFATLYYVLVEFVKLIAPIAPFLSEAIYQNLAAVNGDSHRAGTPESVHLSDFPVFDAKLAAETHELLTEMEIVREVVTLGQSIRALKGIKVRQPLNKIVIKPVSTSKAGDMPGWMQDLITEELNLKKAEFVKELPAGADWVAQLSELSELSVALDTKLTPELQREGLVREFVRVVTGLLWK